MKTETQIAQENIQELIRTSKYEDLQATVLYWKGICYFHKETCQRWLEFLDDKYFVIPPNEKCLECIEIMPEIEKKITDLKKAIKLYTENGI